MEKLTAMPRKQKSKSAFFSTAILITSLLTGCTTIESLMVSERGKSHCLNNTPPTSSSFIDELNYRKCLKTADSKVAEEVKNIAKAEEERRKIIAASTTPAYIKQWEADKHKWEKALTPDLASCENLGGTPADRRLGIRPVSAEDNEAFCKSRALERAEEIRQTEAGFSDQISTFEGWYKWAFMMSRRWGLGEVEYIMKN